MELLSSRNSFLVSEWSDHLGHEAKAAANDLVVVGEHHPDSLGLARPDLLRFSRGPNPDEDLGAGLTPRGHR